MERKTNTNGTEMDEPATPKAMNDTVEETAKVPPRKGGPTRRYLGSGVRLTRHLLEMVVAMLAGMAVFGLAIWALGEPPGYSGLLVEYGLMGVFMSAPMVAWMRLRGHSWSEGGEMTAAMLSPMFALVFPVELGLLGVSGHSLMMFTHVAMIGGMVAMMVYRWDRYAHGGATAAPSAPRPSESTRR